MFLRQTLIFFLLLYFCGRVGLIIHEIFGHGLMAYFFGAQIKSIDLFLFGGGIVHYTHGTSISFYRSLINMGGILAELLCAFGLITLEKCSFNSLPNKYIYSCMSMVLGLHALYYLISGIYFGYADGRMLFAELGNFRYPFIFLMTLVLLFMSYSYAIRLTPFVQLQVDANTHLNILKKALLPFICAVIFHFGLFYVEARIATPISYQKNFVSIHQKKIDAAVQKLTKESDQPISLTQKAQIVKKYKPYPVKTILFLIMGLGLLTGFWRSQLNPVRNILLFEHRFIIRLFFLAIGVLCIIFGINYIM